jgi:nucleoside-diphosphate-sugar epimerase
MKKVLVTGGRGFIGSHLVNHLKQKNLWVRGVDIVKDSYLQTKEDEFLQLDLRNYESCVKALRDIDRVYHTSAHMGGIFFISTVHADIMHHSTLMNIHMLEACKDLGVKRMLFTSSACIYPKEIQLDAEIVPLKELDAYPSNPPESYGKEKLYMEQLMEAYSEDYGLEIRVSRLHNIYGPYGTYKGNKEKAPAALCRKVAYGKDGENIIVWGDGQQTRSFCYVDDCVRGLYMLMNSDISVPLNVGSDRLVTMDELANIVIDISGKDLSIEHDITKPQGVRGRNADLTLVKKLLNWEPKISLEEGLSITYHWIAEQVRQNEENSS